MTSTDITVSPPATAIPTREEWAGIREIAATLAESGLFKDARQASTAIAKVTFGRDLGLGATQAMTGIHIVEGKPELSANLQAALLRQYRAPEGWRYDYRADVSPQGCTIDLFRVYPNGDREEVGRTSFTMDDARRAGLAGRKGPWQSYPANMCFARCLSNAVAFHAPEVTYGTRVYSPGEIGGPVDGPPADPPTVDAPIDREIVAVLKTAVRAHGVTTARLAELLAAYGAPERIQPFAAWLDAIPDSVIGSVAAHIEAGGPIEDAEVIAEALGPVTDAEAFTAWEDEARARGSY